MGGGKDRNKVVFGRTNRAFGWIRTVIRGGDKLVGEVAEGEESAELGRVLVV